MALIPGFEASEKLDGGIQKECRRMTCKLTDLEMAELPRHALDPVSKLPGDKRPR